MNPVSTQNGLGSELESEFLAVLCEILMPMGSLKGCSISFEIGKDTSCLLQDKRLLEGTIFHTFVTEDICTTGRQRYRETFRKQVTSPIPAL
jgi:hypothetical protein